jgi:hypothetical protein
MSTRLTGKIAVAAMLAVGLLGAAGCGGGGSKSSSASSSSTASTPALSKAEFLKRGNAICKRGNDQINAQGKQLFKPHTRPTAAQRKQFGESAIPVIQGEINGVRALPAPTGDRATIAKIADTAQKDLDKVKADPSSLAGTGDPFKDANKLANNYGLTACGSG